MKGPATELIHAGETDRGVAVPLTTPIYETTTFVFDNAAEVVAFNEGRSEKYLYSRYGNPTVVSTERQIAAPESASSTGFRRRICSRSAKVLVGASSPRCP